MRSSDSTRGRPASQRGSKWRQKRAGRKQPSLLPDIADLIDREFDRKVTITDRDRRKRVSVFEAIYRQLWIQEMRGIPRALETRRLFEIFARQESPRREREIIIVRHPANGDRSEM